MSITAATSNYNELLGDLGKATLSAIFPNDFEIYLMALELTDSKGNTIDYLTFPIMPDSISKTELKRTNVKKTSNGITVLTSSSNTPSEVTLKGNFGRNFKIILSPKLPETQGVAFSVSSGKFDLSDVKSGLSFTTPSFSAGIKTGYGASKILQAILSKSNGVDSEGKPFRLYLYNMALGESYLVTVPPSGFSFSQNKEKNMIWEYSITLTILAPLKSIQSQFLKSSPVKLLSRGVIQKGVNVLAKDITSTF